MIHATQKVAPEWTVISELLADDAAAARLVNGATVTSLMRERKMGNMTHYIGALQVETAPGALAALICARSCVRLHGQMHAVARLGWRQVPCGLRPQLHAAAWSAACRRRPAVFASSSAVGSGFTLLAPLLTRPLLNQHSPTCTPRPQAARACARVVPALDRG